MLADIVAVILAILVSAGGLVYLFALIRYVRSGQYDVDKRLQKLSRQ